MRDEYMKDEENAGLRDQGVQPFVTMKRTFNNNKINFN